MAAVSPCHEAIPHPRLKFAEGIDAGEIASRDDTAVALAMTVGRDPARGQLRELCFFGPLAAAGAVRRGAEQNEQRQRLRLAALAASRAVAVRKANLC
jgi:hypothetical protein